MNHQKAREELHQVLAKKKGNTFQKYKPNGIPTTLTPEIDGGEMGYGPQKFRKIPQKKLDMSNKAKIQVEPNQLGKLASKRKRMV